MVSDFVNKFNDTLSDPYFSKLLTSDALSKEQIFSAAGQDITGSVLDTRDLKDTDLSDHNKILRKFKSTYTAVMNSVRNSILTTSRDIATYSRRITYYKPTISTREASARQVMAILQSADISYRDTNAAWYNLQQTLGEAKWQLTVYGRGLPDDISRQMKALSELTSQLEKTSHARDELRDLYLVRVPKDTDLNSYTGLRSPMAAAASAIPPDRHVYRKWCRNLVMVINCHILGIEAAKMYYQIGGDISEIDASFDKAETLKNIEEALDLAHDSLRVSLVDILTEMARRADNCGAIGEDASREWTRLANEINAVLIPAKGRNVEQRKGMSHFELQALDLKRLAIEAFQVPLPADARFIS